MISMIDCLQEDMVVAVEETMEEEEEVAAMAGDKVILLNFLG